jgi:hypothetical protein
MALSPGVLPAVIRAWDFEWTGPVARTRYRLFLGDHLEMGRPGPTRDAHDAELVISLLPVGEDHKPNAALIAMLSRQAFVVDLTEEGTRVKVLNKASAHMSPDPHRPYWDWDNPMPGAERLIAPSETLWVSPHFGKQVAPISVRTVSSGESETGPFGCELRFDPVFHDLAGTSVLLLPETFGFHWGAESALQVSPGVGEGSEALLHLRVTGEGLTATPLGDGTWTRRQGRMVREQTLLLGGVSSVEWKSERGDVALKMVPHALPRLGVSAPRSGPPTRRS